MKKLIFIIFIITLIGLSPLLFQYGVGYFAADYTLQQVPFIYEIKRMLSSGTPFWSWNTLLGDNFIGSYSFYNLTSPFTWINCLFPYEYIGTGITFTFILKFIFIGIFAYLYFKKMNINKDLCLIGALLYTFSSFTISNVCYHFSEAIMCFPLFLLSIEKFLNKEKYSKTILCLSSFLVSFTNYYFIPCTFLAGLIYTLCRINSKEIRCSLKDFINAIFLIIIGLLISSIILIPTLYQLSGGPRNEINLEINKIENLFERFRVIFIPKITEGPNTMLLFSDTSWRSNAANISVIGFLCAILYCVKRNDWIKWLICISIVIYLTPLNGIFSLFTNSLYTRWSYALTLFIILASIKYLNDIKKLQIKEVCRYSILCISIFCLFFVPKIIICTIKGYNITENEFYTTLFILFLLIINLLCLYVYTKRSTTSTLLICIIICSTLHLSIRLYYRSDSYLNKIELSESRNHSYIKKYILNNNLPMVENGFKYRTDFITRENNIYANMAMLSNRPSVCTYHSIQNNNIRQLLNIIYNTKIPNRNAFEPTKNRTSFNSLMSVKEIIDYKDSLANTLNVDGISLKKETKEYNIYDFKYYIPIGFSYSSFITENQLDSLISKHSQIDVPMQLLANLVIKDKDVSIIKKYIPQGKINLNHSIDRLVKERKLIHCQDFNGTTKGFTASIKVPKDNIIFFSVPADKGFTAYLDKNKIKIYNVNLGLSAIIVPQGKHLIEFNYIPYGLHIGGYLSILGLIIMFAIFIYELKYTNNKNETKFL